MYLRKPAAALLAVAMLAVAMSATAGCAQTETGIAEAVEPAARENTPVVIDLNTTQEANAPAPAVATSAPAGTIVCTALESGAVCTALPDGGNEITGGLVEIVVTGVSLSGTIRTTEGGSARIILRDGASLTAQLEGDAMLDISVSLDETSRWTLPAEARVDAVINGDGTFANVESNGFDLYYNCENSENAYLGRATVPLSGGGALTPLI